METIYTCSHSLAVVHSQPFSAANGTGKAIQVLVEILSDSGDTLTKSTRTCRLFEEKVGTVLVEVKLTPKLGPQINDNPVLYFNVFVYRFLHGSNAALLISAFARPVLDHSDGEMSAFKFRILICGFMSKLPKSLTLLQTNNVFFVTISTQTLLSTHAPMLYLYLTCRTLEERLERTTFKLKHLLDNSELNFLSKLTSTKIDRYLHDFGTIVDEIQRCNFFWSRYSFYYDLL